MGGGRLPKRVVFGNLGGTVRRGWGGKEKEWTDCVQSDIRAFGIAGDWKATALEAEVWVETVTEGWRRFMAAWRKDAVDAVDAARHLTERDWESCLKNQNAPRPSEHPPVIAHGNVEFCEAAPIGLVDESKESLYGRKTDRDLRSAWACKCVA